MDAEEHEGRGPAGKSRPVSRRGRAPSARPVQKTVRFGTDEFEAIARSAADMNVSPVSYVAMAAVASARGEDSPAANAPLRDALIELMRSRTQVVKVGTNLNQLVRSMQSIGQVPESIDWAVRVNQRAVETVERAAERVHKLLVQSR